MRKECVPHSPSSCCGGRACVRACVHALLTHNKPTFSVTAIRRMWRRCFFFSRARGSGERRRRRRLNLLNDHVREKRTIGAKHEPHYSKMRPTRKAFQEGVGCGETSLTRAWRSGEGSALNLSVPVPSTLRRLTRRPFKSPATPHPSLYPPPNPRQTDTLVIRL